MITGMHPAQMASASRGDHTRWPWGHRQNLEVSRCSIYLRETDQTCARVCARQQQQLLQWIHHCSGSLLRPRILEVEEDPGLLLLGQRTVAPNHLLAAGDALVHLQSPAVGSQIRSDPA